MMIGGKWQETVYPDKIINHNWSCRNLLLDKAIISPGCCFKIVRIVCSVVDFDICYEKLRLCLQRLLGCDLFALSRLEQIR